MSAGRPRIGLILTGGTMQSVGVDRLDIAWYRASGRPPGDLLGRVPELDGIAEIEQLPFAGGPSPSFDDGVWFALLDAIGDALAGGVLAGLVVTHGTNMLEETAYFLHLTLKTTSPVVVTGSMRPLSALSGDADLNLVNAVRVAASPQAAGKGVLVVLNDTIHSARDVTKSSTQRVQSFVSRDAGPLGYADNDGRVVFHHAPVRAHTAATELDPRGLSGLPRVEVVLSYLGADGALIDAAVAAGAEGVVSASTGSGWPTPGEEAALERARAAGVAVCIASRTGSGRVTRGPWLVSRGYVAADNLLPWKARVLLALGLTVTREPDELQGMFDRY
jgi:L-asparaginase